MAITDSRQVRRRFDSTSHGRQRDRVRVPRPRRRRCAARPVAALPRQPRQLGPCARRRARRGSTRGHVRQRRRRRHDRQRRRTPSRPWPTTRSPSSRRWSFQRVDLLGFSIGSFVAQEIALIRPDLLRRVVLASSAPQGAAGMHGWAPEVIGAVGAPETSPQGYLDVFFAPTDTSREAGQQAAGRIFGKDERPRRADDVADPPGAVRRRVRVGHPQPLAAPASRRDRPAGVRRQRRQRPDDPSPLLAPAGRAPPGRAAHDLPGLGARLSLPAPRASSPPTSTPSSRRPTDADDRRLRRRGNLRAIRTHLPVTSRRQSCVGSRSPTLPLFANNTAAFIHEHGCSRDLAMSRGRATTCESRYSPLWGARPRQATRCRQGAHGHRRGRRRRSEPARAHVGAAVRSRPRVAGGSAVTPTRTPTSRPPRAPRLQVDELRSLCRRDCPRTGTVPVSLGGTPTV